jgi:hypothetical protein
MFSGLICSKPLTRPLILEPEQFPMSSPEQIAANQANAQRSTGPTSSEGKLKISHNALKTGLTGRTVLLPSEDVAAYQAHVQRVFDEYGPVTGEEQRLAHCVADTLWRLERIPVLEAGIYAIGRRQLADQFADESDEAVRKAMVEAQIFLTYRRDLNNLSIQENRLRRLYEKDDADLNLIINEREQAERDLRREQEHCMQLAISNYQDAQEQGMAFDPAELGFEFSTEEIVARIDKQKRQGAANGGRYYEFKKEGYFQPPKKAA